jgi:ABC-type sugar transport system ATPase subunit
MMTESESALEQLDIEIPNLARPMREMSGGQRQAVAIARAVYWNARLMIMDEPTAALAVAEQRKVLALCRTLRDQNVPVIIISHNLQDVFAVADRIVVLRRARKVAELDAHETDTDEVVALMTGSKPGEF